MPTSHVFVYQELAFMRATADFAYSSSPVMRQRMAVSSAQRPSIPTVFSKPLSDVIAPPREYSLVLVPEKDDAFILRNVE